MGTVVLIGTVAIVVAIVGCFFIWRLDASRAEEVEHTAPPPPPSRAHGLEAREAHAPPRSLES